jgi:hypothetical protein
MIAKNERLIFIRNKWEIAHKEGDSWIRRDMSWICRIGEEIAILPMPAKPAQTLRLHGVARKQAQGAP